MTYSKFYRKSTLNKPQSIFFDVLAHPKANVSKEIEKILNEYKDKTGISIAKLMAIAIDNELSAANPFEYEIPDITKMPFSEEHYQSEAASMIRYISQYWSGGIDYQQLLLCRHDFGIEKKEVVMLACRKLIHEEQLEELTLSGRFTPLKRRGVKLTLNTLEYLKKQKLEKLRMDRGVLK